MTDFTTNLKVGEILIKKENKGHKNEDKTIHVITEVFCAVNILTKNEKTMTRLKDA